MAGALVTATKEFSSRSVGFVAVKTVTTDGSGDGSVAHGMTNEDGTGKTPFAAFGVPLDGADQQTATVTVTSANIVIAGGGATKVWTLVAFG